MASHPTPVPRAEYRAFRAISTRWSDADAYGHLSIAAYLSCFETAVNGWLVERGLLVPGRGAQIGMVAETGCRVHSDMAFPDAITAGIRVARLGLSSVRYEIGLFRADADVASAEGFVVHIHVDAESRRPMPLLGELRAGLAALGPQKREL